MIVYEFVAILFLSLRFNQETLPFALFLSLSLSPVSLVYSSLLCILPRHSFSLRFSRVYSDKQTNKQTHIARFIPLNLNKWPIWFKENSKEKKRKFEQEKKQKHTTNDSCWGWNKQAKKQKNKYNCRRER